MTYTPSGIKSVQYGSITVAVPVGMGRTIGTATVAAVNTAKSVIVPLGAAQEATPTHTQSMSPNGTWELTNATTVTVNAYTRSDVGGNMTYRFCLVEFA